MGSSVELRERFRAYLDSRIATYPTPGEFERAAELARTTRLQGEIWALAITALRASADPPAIIFGLLLGLALTAALLAGYSSAEAPAPSRIHLLSFAVAITAAIAVIVDLEYPRLGLIRVDAVDQLLVDLRSSMD